MLPDKNCEDLLEELCQLDPKALVPFVGAGFCRDLGFPLWQGLLERLADAVERDSEEVAGLMRQRIRARALMSAADAAYYPEVRTQTRVDTLKTIFELPASLPARHRHLGSIPCAGIITTNYDGAIEKSLVTNSRVPTTYRGADRIRQFSSNFRERQTKFGKLAADETPVLKLHNDIKSCEEIVLSTQSFRDLSSTTEYTSLFQNLLRNCHLIFLGFSGADPNLEREVLKAVASVAGYGLAQSYMFLSRGTPAPTLPDDAPITVARYSPDNDHAELAEVLDRLSRCWTQRFLDHYSQSSEDLTQTCADVVIVPNSERGPHIFDLLPAAVETSADGRVVDTIGVGMVQTARAAALPETDERSIVNRLCQLYRLGADRAREIYIYYGSAESTQSSAIYERSKPGARRMVLVNGIMDRVRAYDPDTHLRPDSVSRCIADVVEQSLIAYGCQLALALVDQSDPSSQDVSRIIRQKLDAGTWSGIGEFDKEALTLAIPDLFLRPSEPESKVITSMAVAAASFGLIQALPSIDQVDNIVPARLYLDATVVLPLLARLQPRCDTYEELLALAGRAGAEAVVLEPFLTEVVAHRRNALRSIEQNGLAKVSDVIAYVDDPSSDHGRNVFLGAIAQNFSSSPGAEARTTLSEVAPFGDGARYAKVLESYGIGVASVDDAVKGSPRKAHLKQQLLMTKKGWRKLSEHARSTLADHEAALLMTLESDFRKGSESWFITGDAELRRVAQDDLGTLSHCLLPADGAVAVLEGLTKGISLSPAFPRVLWRVSWEDTIDQILGEELLELLQQGSGPRLPIEQARANARRALRDRSSRYAGSTEEISARQVVKRSIYQAIGRELSAED